MSGRPSLRAIVMLAIVTLGALGCSNVLAPRPDPTHFFILSANPSGIPQGVAARSSTRLEIGLGPVAFPDYLARAEIVTRAADNRIEIAPNDRWAEPLDVTFKRVLALDLSSALDGARVTEFPWFSTTPQIAYRIEVTVDRFECDAQGTAHLAARWSIVQDTGGATLYASSSSISVPGAAHDYPALATALSSAENQFASELAAALKRLTGPA